MQGTARREIPPLDGGLYERATGTIYDAQTLGVGKDERMRKCGFAGLPRVIE